MIKNLPTISIQGICTITCKKYASLSIITIFILDLYDLSAGFIVPIFYDIVWYFTIPSIYVYIYRYIMRYVHSFFFCFSTKSIQVLSELRWEVVVRLADIGVIFYHFSWILLFIRERDKLLPSYITIHFW